MTLQRSGRGLGPCGALGFQPRSLIVFAIEVYKKIPGKPMKVWWNLSLLSPGVAGGKLL